MTGSERLRDASDAALAMVTAAVTDAAAPAEVLASYMEGTCGEVAAFTYEVALVLMAWTKGLLMHVDVDPLAFLQVLAAESQRELDHD